MRSVVRHGHPLTLWSYAPVEGVPDGVDLADAADILPEDALLRYPGGSVAIFANWFRYELQRRGAGIWLDADLYLLQPIASGASYILSEYEPGRINNGGVLRLPPDSPLLPPLLALFEQRTVPPWLPPRARLAAWWRLLRTGRSNVTRMPWGSTGPRAITALAHRSGLAHLAAAPEIYSPVRWQDAAWIADPRLRLEDRVTPRTVALHLWNERIKAFKDAPAADGSFLARLHREGA